MELSRIIAAFCNSRQWVTRMIPCHALAWRKTPSSVVLTLAILAAMDLGGNPKKTLSFAKDFHLFSYIPSPSRFSRRFHTLKLYLLALLPLLSHLWKHQHYAPDTFPIPVCLNIRAPRSKLAPGRVYRGYIPSQRVYFHGYKLHLRVDDRRFIHEMGLTPGSFHDLSSLFLLPLQIEEGKPLYLNRGYPSDVGEEGLLEAGLLPRPIRPARRERYVPCLQYLAIASRGVVANCSPSSALAFNE